MLRFKATNIWYLHQSGANGTDIRFQYVHQSEISSVPLLYAAQWNDKTPCTWQVLLFCNTVPEILQRGHVQWHTSGRSHTQPVGQRQVFLVLTLDALTWKANQRQLRQMSTIAHRGNCPHLWLLKQLFGHQLPGHAAALSPLRLGHCSETSSSSWTWKQ